ncbi:Putative ribonuclease H protein At1g65750, partial [Linum perenne]
LLIAWRTTGEGWCTLNSDCSFYSISNSATTGDLIRDHDGRFICGFVSNLRTCSIMRAELRGILEGLELVWSKGIRKLCIQSDSKAAVSIILHSSRTQHQHSALINRFNQLFKRDWEVKVEHIYCEANKAANFLANSGHVLGLGTSVFSVPNSYLVQWLRYDQLGICSPRVVNNIQ